MQVARPADYCPQAAVMLGPTEANPAVLAAVAQTTAAIAAADGDEGRAAGSAACASNGNGSSFAAAVRSCAVPAAVAVTHGGRPLAPTAAGGGAGAAAADGSAAGKGGARDLLLPADQSKQDEVFIGGLPSHWKAQQVGFLLKDMLMDMAGLRHAASTSCCCSRYQHGLVCQDAILCFQAAS